MKLGWELPNQARDLTAEEWERVDALNSGAVKVRPYNLTAANLSGIRQRGLTVILRPDSDEGVNFSAGARYQELAAALDTLLTYAAAIYCIPDNEPNHPNNAAAPSADYWARCWQVAEWLAQSYPSVKYLTPPLATGHDESAWYNAGKGVIPRFDGVAFHAYGQLDTGLLLQSAHLATQFGIPVIADEVGDSHPTAGWDAKGEALRVYLSTLKAHGVAIACIFHVGGSPEWANFVPPLDTVHMLAASVPQEVPDMPVQTVITALNRPVAQQGGVASFSFLAEGIDGTAKGFADVAYPIIPGSQTEERYGPNLTTELPVFLNGQQIVTLNVPLATTPTPGPVVAGITLRIIELDGVNFDGGAFGPFPVDLVPGVPTPPLPPPVINDLPPYLHVAYHGLHEAELAAMEAGDTLLLLEIQQGIAVIDRRKSGDFR